MKKKSVVLIVDDEPDLHHILKIALSKSSDAQFEFENAMDGKEAIKKYDELVEKGKKPDLVLMDIKMPVMDGVKSTKAILKKHPDANIYALTAYAGTPLAAKATKAGVKGIIDKSNSFLDLLNEIKKVLKKK